MRKIIAQNEQGPSYCLCLKSLLIFVKFRSGFDFLKVGVPHWEFPHWEFPGKSGFWDSQFPGKKFQNSLGKKIDF